MKLIQHNNKLFYFFTPWPDEQEFVVEKSSSPVGRKQSLKQGTQRQLSKQHSVEASPAKKLNLFKASSKQTEEEDEVRVASLYKRYLPSLVVLCTFIMLADMNIWHMTSCSTTFGPEFHGLSIQIQPTCTRMSLKSSGLTKWVRLWSRIAQQRDQCDTYWKTKTKHQLLSLYQFCCQKMLYQYNSYILQYFLPFS